MVDLDVLFSYKTIKIVTIQDRRLGILHYLFQIAILIYIIVYTLIIQQRYLLSEPPFGAIRATVREPQGTNWLAAEDYSYCEQNQTTKGNFTNYPCIYMLGYDMVFPPAPTGSIFISTRVKDATFAAPPGCFTTYTPTSSKCIPEKTSQTDYFTAGVEDFTLFMEHAIYGRITDTKTSNHNLHGTLNFKNSKQTVDFDDEDRTGDIITVSTLLEAAGLNTLDDYSGLVNSTKSYRYDGILIMMVITYSNNPSHPSKLSYKYDAHILRGVEEVAMEPTVVWSATNSTTERNRHGIMVQFLVTGSVGKFDFPTLLLTIVSALVLLNVATAIVDLLLIYVMPDKKIYKSHKFELTEDFSEVRMK